MSLRTYLLTPVMLLIAATFASALAAQAAEARAVPACRPEHVVGWSAPGARVRLRKAHCAVRVRRLGDMGTGPLRVVHQVTTRNGAQRIEVSRRGGRCRFARPYWKIAASNDVAIVAHMGRDADELWVCVRATGERRLLGETIDLDPDWEGFEGMRLAGPWLAYVVASAGRYGSGSGIVLVDLRRKGGTQRLPGPSEAIPKELVLNEAGDMAWSHEGGPTTYGSLLDAQVWVRPVGGPTRVVLARPTRVGVGPALADLAIGAETVTWNESGVPGSAPIHSAD